MNLLPVYKKQIIILHHIDIAKAKTNILQKFFNIALLYKVKKVHQVVVVSRYWYEFLLNEGVDSSKIHIIYNSYDFKKYNFSSKKISLFKKNMV